jgi:uncharacterized protein
MANPAGSFIWYELMTPDPDAIAPFYEAVVGWRISAGIPGQTGGMDYRQIGRADRCRCPQWTSPSAASRW